MLSSLRALGLAGISLAILAGCGGPSSPAISYHAPTGLAALADQAPKDKAAFLAELKSRSIKLSEKDLATLIEERHLTPSGQFAARPAANLTSEQNLTVHFKKHGHEFSPNIPSEQAYIDQGIDAATGDRGTVRFFFDTTSFKKGYQSHIVRWVPSTKDFTAFRADGAMTTYYRNFKVSPKRFIEVPALR